MSDHVLTLSVTAEGQSLSKELTKSAGLGLTLDEAVPNASTNLAIAFAAVRAKLKYFYMTCDQAVIIETNSGSAADNTFTMAAGDVILWYEGCGVAVNTFFAADIASIFATNASGSTANLKIRAKVDPT